MFQLEPSQTSNLLAQPESGMGFQLVEVTTADQRVAKGVVYNADLLLLDSEPKSRLLTESYERLVRAAEKAGGRIRAIRVVQRASAAIPQTGTAIQRGIVEPAFGQPGGGVEVIFPEGTQPASVTGPDKIPD